MHLLRPTSKSCPVLLRCVTSICGVSQQSAGDRDLVIVPVSGRGPYVRVTERVAERGTADVRQRWEYRGRFAAVFPRVGITTQGDERVVSTSRREINARFSTARKRVRSPNDPMNAITKAELADALNDYLIAHGAGNWAWTSRSGDWC